jgi:hypothetical protein
MDLFKSLAVIPNPSQAFDEVYATVNRANGRTIERMALRLESIDCADEKEVLLADQIFMDGAVSYGIPISVDAIESQGASTIVSTATAHGLSSGQLVSLSCAGDFDGRFEVEEIVADTSIALLLHFESDFSDSSCFNHVPTESGGIGITTASPIIGSGSGSFDGSDDYLIYPYHSIFDLDQDDFIIECRFIADVLPDTFGFKAPLLARAGGAHDGAYFLYIRADGLQGSGKWDISLDLIGTAFENGGIIANDVVLTTGTEYHLRVTRTSGVLAMYLDGVDLSTVYSMSITNPTINITNTSADYKIYIGVDDNTPAEFFEGKIDEFLIATGISTYSDDTPMPNPVCPGTSFRILDAFLGTPIDSSAFTAYAGGGFLVGAQNVFAGLDHLEGQEVSVLADGAVLPRETVSGGQVELDNSYSTVHIGLPYNSDFKTLPLEIEQ